MAWNKEDTENIQQDYSQYNKTVPLWINRPLSVQLVGNGKRERGVLGETYPLEKVIDMYGNRPMEGYAYGLPMTTESALRTYHTPFDHELMHVMQPVFRFGSVTDNPIINSAFSEWMPYKSGEYTGSITEPIEKWIFGNMDVGEPQTDMYAKSYNLLNYYKNTSGLNNYHDQLVDIKDRARKKLLDNLDALDVYAEANKKIRENPAIYGYYNAQFPAAIKIYKNKGLVESPNIDEIEAYKKARSVIEPELMNYSQAANALDLGRIYSQNPSSLAGIWDSIVKFANGLSPWTIGENIGKKITKQVGKLTGNKMLKYQELMEEE